ncbi:NUDIX domain-containing protein [Ensifer sp. NM-2]|uniref:NUDIX domain-containing protein n=1 Tax=Ensifer sp. NM-2 TaxID=2109730 RepID=UPI001FDF439A|nr:NUDIX domain-containing protein [Ensifer sp. NM-2]
MNAAGNTLLVRKRGTRSFMQAGGKIEAGETPREALSRELASKCPPICPNISGGLSPRLRTKDLIR